MRLSDVPTPRESYKFCLTAVANEPATYWHFMLAKSKNTVMKQTKMRLILSFLQIICCNFLFLNCQLVPIELQKWCINMHVQANYSLRIQFFEQVKLLCIFLIRISSELNRTLIIGPGPLAPQNFILNWFLSDPVDTHNKIEVKI